MTKPSFTPRLDALLTLFAKCAKDPRTALKFRQEVDQLSQLAGALERELYGFTEALGRPGDVVLAMVELQNFTNLIGFQTAREVNAYIKKLEEGGKA